LLVVVMESAGERSSVTKLPLATEMQEANAMNDKRDDATIRDGSLIIEEGMNRRDGLVEYEGTTGAGSGQDATTPVARTETTTVTTQTTTDLPEIDTIGSPAMQAGATVLGGTGTTALVDDATTLSASSGSSDLSMSTDNTRSGGAGMATADAGLLGQISEGMKVVDASGDDLGKVVAIKMGDPGAATTAGEMMDSPGGTLGAVGDAVLGGGIDPDLEEPMRSELLRSGYIKIDGKGWFGTDRYVPADQVAGVSGDTVRLGVTKDQMTSGS